MKRIIFSASTTLLIILFNTDSYAKNSMTREHTPHIQRAQVTPEAFDLGSVYDDFKQDGVISIYFGMGYEMYQSGNEETFALMLKGMLRGSTETISNFTYNSHTRTASFIRDSDQIKFQITIGGERNEWIDAWDDKEVIMYHGHSRYGMGPTFGGWNNYFRMGQEFDTIEVDTRNRYFHTEPFASRARHPVQRARVNGEDIEYQYRGALDSRSKLPSSSYTKQIESHGKDLREVKAIGTSRSQIFWLYSCKNYQYWRDELRQKFPHTSTVAIFGTIDDSMWGFQPSLTFVFELVNGNTNASEITSRLNATGDCNDCFTTY